MYGKSKDDMMQSILEANEQRPAENSRKQQEKQTQEEADQQYRQAIKEEKDRFVSEIRTVIDKFNGRSSSGHISVKQFGNTFQYSLPQQEDILELRFFEVKPSLDLSIKDLGFVSFAAYLEGLNGTGRNFLWCQHSSENIQGKWIACRVNTSAGVRPDRGYKPYGIIYGFENPQELQEIVKSISATHVYEVRFEDDVRKELMEVLLDAIKRP
jgi:hypothetical protein